MIKKTIYTIKKDLAYILNNKVYIQTRFAILNYFCGIVLRMLDHTLASGHNSGGNIVTNKDISL